MTSNIGSQYIQDWNGKDFASLEATLSNELKKYFRPEFINRVDDIVIFDRIQAEHMKEIVGVQLQRTAEQIKKTKDITLQFTDKAEEALAMQGFDPAYGARPLKRVIQTKILNPLAAKIIEGTVQENDHLLVDVKNGKYTFKTM